MIARSVIEKEDCDEIYLGSDMKGEKQKHAVLLVC